MRPTEPGYDLATADLQRLRVSSTDLARVLGIATGGDPANIANPQGDPTVALLAQIALTQRVANARYTSQGFTLAAWTRYQILQENPNRKALLIQNVGSGDLMVYLGSSNVNPQDLSGVDGQVELTAQQALSFRIVAGGSYEPYVVPTNAITIFTISTGTLGVAAEGI